MVVRFALTPLACSGRDRQVSMLQWGQLAWTRGWLESYTVGAHTARCCSTLGGVSNDFAMVVDFSEMHKARERVSKYRFYSDLYCINA